ncbi:MAG: LysR family transcriptional regulator [Clostridiales bacterium]|nr:LysR family transcriptional regulator [Clostridiales bacterium]
MYIHYLYYFRTLAECQNYTKTAEQLHITQPSLSYAIGKLEADLGCVLFDRNGRNVVLSACGRTYYEYACEAIDALENGKKAVAGQKEHQEIRIGATKTMIQSSYLSWFLADYGQPCSVHSYRSSSLIYEDILHAQLDVGICLKHKGKSFQQFLFYERDVLAITGKGHPLAALSEISLTELLQFDLVFYKPSPVYDRIREIFPEDDRLATCTFQEEYIDIISYAANNQRVAIAVEDALNYDTALYHACRIRQEELNFNLYLTIRRDLPKYSAAYRFCQHCRTIPGRE